MTNDLFSPVTLGEIALKNRVVMAPLTRNRAGEGGVPLKPKTVPKALWRGLVGEGRFCRETSPFCRGGDFCRDASLWVRKERNAHLEGIG